MRGKSFPPSFEECETKSKKHMMRCTKKTSSGIQCQCVFRFAAKGHPHTCKYPLLDTFRVINNEEEIFYPLLPSENRIMGEISNFFINYNVPFSAIQSEYFYNLLEAFVQMTQIDLNAMNSKKIFTPKFLADFIISSSEQTERNFYDAVSRVGIVHFAIDEGTFHHRHFLDVLILTPYNQIQPFLGFTLEEESLSKEDLADFIHSCILQVQAKNCTVVSIIADNLRIHSLTFAHWKPPFGISFFFPD
jgi:hypothetical protein